MPTLIFVHGACVRDAAWWWSKMTKPLADRGIATAVVPLSSCGEASEKLGDLYDDVDSCRRAIAAVDGPVVLCGHSYGGVIITEAGGDDRVTQLLYVTSVMPDEDLATPAETQRRRVRAGAGLVEFDSGHHPFLSRPTRSRTPRSCARSGYSTARTSRSR